MGHDRSRDRDGDLSRLRCRSVRRDRALGHGGAGRDQSRTVRGEQHAGRGPPAGAAALLAGLHRQPAVRAATCIQRTILFPITSLPGHRTPDVRISSASLTRVYPPIHCGPICSQPGVGHFACREVSGEPCRPLLCTTHETLRFGRQAVMVGYLWLVPASTGVSRGTIPTSTAPTPRMRSSS